MSIIYSNIHLILQAMYLKWKEYNFLIHSDEEIYDGDFVYESIYEVIPQDSSQVKVNR